jgi:DNA-binding GntR family transcriptional regulator
VFEELRTAIRNLTLTPGQALSETELASQLHVSRTPVREAISRLADIGLVVVVPQVGTSVSLIRLDDVRQAQFIRESLEVAAFERACAPERPPADHLDALLERQRRACDDGDTEAFFTADEELHAGIFELSGFPGAWQAVQRSKLQLDRLRRLTLPERSTIEQLITEHTDIVQSLKQRNAAAGKRHVRRHARRVLRDAAPLRSTHPQYFAD